MSTVDNVYVTTEGVEVKLNPVSVLEIEEIRLSVTKQFRAQGKQVEPPEYKVKVGDTEQVFKHDENSIADKNTPQAEKDAWNKYQQDINELTATINEKLSTLIYSDGIVVDEIPIAWEEQRKWKGLEIPDNYYDKKIKYVMTALLKTPADMKEVVVKVMKLSTTGVSQEEIEAAEATFRSKTHKR